MVGNSKKNRKVTYEEVLKGLEKKGVVFVKDGNSLGRYGAIGPNISIVMGKKRSLLGKMKFKIMKYFRK